MKSDIVDVIEDSLSGGELFDISYGDSKEWVIDSVCIYHMGMKWYWFSIY